MQTVSQDLSSRDRWPTYRALVLFALLAALGGARVQLDGPARTPVAQPGIAVCERRSATDTMLQPGNTCTLDHTVGSVRVTESRDAVCRVRTCVRAAATTALEAARRAHAISVRCEIVSGALSVSTVFAPPSARPVPVQDVASLISKHASVEVDYEVELPRGIPLVVRSIAGDIAVRVSSPVDVRSLAGRIEVDGNASPLTVDTVSAPVTVNSRGAVDRRSRIRTVSSNVEVRQGVLAPRATAVSVPLHIERSADQSVEEVGSTFDTERGLAVTTVRGQGRQVP